MTAAENRLVGPGVLFAFAAVFTAMLVLVFPTDREYAELAAPRQPDAYSLAYLSALTRANPGDVHLRVGYVRQLAAVGRYDDAFEALAPALARAEVAGEVGELHFDLALSRARALPLESAERAHAFAAVADALPALLVATERPERLTELAAIALELELPALAARAYGKLADRVPAERAACLVKSARWLRASGDAPGAARAYRAAQLAETNAAAAREDALAAISSIEAADRPNEAADLAWTEAHAYWNDADMVARAASLATACGRAVPARDLGRRLLEIGPDSDDALFGQVRRELAAGDPRAALALVQRLTRRYPSDASLREIEGRVSEWAGHPETALQDWLFLLDHPVRGPRRFELR